MTFEQCRIHHVHWWDHHGLTDLENLIPLCALHHHLVHEGGWTLTLQPDRAITLRRPDGTLHYHGTTVDRTTRSSGASAPPPDQPAAPAEPGARPARPCECEIPLHLRRKAEETRATDRAAATTEEPDTEPATADFADLFSLGEPAAADHTPTDRSSLIEATRRELQNCLAAHTGAAAAPGRGQPPPRAP